MTAHEAHQSLTGPCVRSVTHIHSELRGYFLFNKAVNVPGLYFTAKVASLGATRKWFASGVYKRYEKKIDFGQQLL